LGRFAARLTRARQGVELDRSTLPNWVGGAVWWLEPLQARLAEHFFVSQTLFADDTPLDPGRGRTKTGRLWVYARDDQPWDRPDPQVAALCFVAVDQPAHRHEGLVVFPPHAPAAGGFAGLAVHIFGVSLLGTRAVIDEPKRTESVWS
jgi:hypothetical protein